MSRALRWRACGTRSPLGATSCGCRPPRSMRRSGCYGLRGSGRRGAPCAPRAAGPPGSRRWTRRATCTRTSNSIGRCGAARANTPRAGHGSHQRPFAAELQRLQTIPGVGPIVAATAVAVFADVQRFPDAKHAASYAGLTPSTHQSGARDVHGRITKRGSAELRAMLCEAAHHAARPQHPLHPYFAQQCAKHGYKRAAIAVAHRLCRIMFAMWRHGRDFDVTKLGIEVGPFDVHPRQALSTQAGAPRPARRTAATRAKIPWRGLVRIPHTAMAPLNLEWETPGSPLSPELSHPDGAPLAALPPGANPTPNGRLVGDGTRVNTDAHSPRASPGAPDSQRQQSCLTPRLHGRTTRPDSRGCSPLRYRTSTRGRGRRRSSRSFRCGAK